MTRHGDEDGEGSGLVRGGTRENSMRRRPVARQSIGGGANDVYNVDNIKSKLLTTDSKSNSDGRSKQEQ